MLRPLVFIFSAVNFQTGTITWAQRIAVRIGVRKACCEQKIRLPTISQNPFELHEGKDLRRKISLVHIKTLFLLPLKPDSLMSKTSVEALMTNSPIRRQ